MFFDRRSTSKGAATIALLDALNAVLLGKAARSDRRAAMALAPYAAWTGFATVLLQRFTLVGVRQAPAPSGRARSTSGHP